MNAILLNIFTQLIVPYICNLTEEFIWDFKSQYHKYQNELQQHIWESREAKAMGKRYKHTVVYSTTNCSEVCISYFKPNSCL